MMGLGEGLGRGIVVDELGQAAIDVDQFVDPRSSR